MRTLHTVEVLAILRREGFIGANIDLRASSVWCMATLQDISNLKTGVAAEHFQYRMEQKIRYATNRYNCVDYTRAFLTLARERHRKSTGEAVRLLVGEINYEPERRNATSRPNVGAGVKTLVDRMHSIVWFICGDAGKERVWTLEPQTDKLWPLTAGEVMSATDLRA